VVDLELRKVDKSFDPIDGERDEHPTFPFVIETAR
jgi:hypothetical protein